MIFRPNREDVFQEDTPIRTNNRVPVLYNWASVYFDEDSECP
jgi:hypothetical protein